MNETMPPSPPPVAAAEPASAATGQPAADAEFLLPPDTCAYYSDHQEERDRLTSFFRLITAIPHMIWLSIYGIAAFVAVVAAWFALLFTARYPAGLYKFVADYHRYYTRAYAYTYLVTDAFPPFGGNAEQRYAAHFLVGPPKESYSRAKTFFRWLLLIPFAIVASALSTVGQFVGFATWVVILFTGRQNEGLQQVLDFCFGFMVRFGSYSALLTEDWPKFTDQTVTSSLQARGYAGTIPPA